jgi:hypothetical protein
MSIAGHVSRAMLSRYSHIRTEAKRMALEDVERKRAAAKGRMKDESHKPAGDAQAPTAPRLQW